MRTESNSVPLIYVNNANNFNNTYFDSAFENTPPNSFYRLQRLIEVAGLPVSLTLIKAPNKLTQKVRQQLSNDYGQPVLIIDEKERVSLLVDGMSVAPDWQSLQRRVVSAGRKSELLLQACKLTDKSQVLDATAGFGHDSLILASTGAHVTLLERSPLMTLMLLNERATMATHKNWQKLMARLTIKFGESIHYMSELSSQSNQKFDVVYLDPMFPENSYDNAQTGKGAKVGKHMQALHHIANLPDIAEERHLLQLGLDILEEGGRVVVKRPVSAPPLASRAAHESWQNDVVRFDGYFS